MSSITEKCKQLLQNYYGTRFQGLILYGSMARREASRFSDIDLLVLLREPFDYFQELRTIVDLLDPVQMECEQLISARPAAIDEFKRGALQLYRNAKREGITL